MRFVWDAESVLRPADKEILEYNVQRTLKLHFTVKYENATEEFVNKIDWNRAKFHAVKQTSWDHCLSYFLC